MQKKIEDSMVSFDLLRKHGYYTVGERIFHSKFNAIRYASSTRQTLQWHFNEEEFGRLNWRERLDLDIRHLYRMRAQQIRDRYDYVILSWSAGGDSTNILQAFLDNNIKLDEVVVFWPLSMSQGKWIPSLDVSSANYLSEWHFTIKPAIDRLQTEHPEIKVTVVEDLNVDMLTQNMSWDDGIIKVEKHNFYTIMKQRALDRYISTRIGQYKNVGMVFGVGPVDVMILDNWLAVSFNDVAAFGSGKTDVNLQGELRNMELFYWTPDLPEMIRQQAHMILDHINRYPATKKLLMQFTMDAQGTLKQMHSGRKFREQWRQVRKTIIYPDYPRDVFQVHKPSNAYQDLDWFSWFTNHPHAQTYLDQWRWCLSNQLSDIAPEYIAPEEARLMGGPFKPCVTKFYLVGKIHPEI